MAVGSSIREQAFREWTECRSTIARMDTILEDLRKFGFTLITGLITANAFLGGPVSGRPAAGVAASIAIVVLVTALFSVDTYYTAGLSGAVERALDLEAKTSPPIRITRSIDTRRQQAGVNWVTFGVYVFLLIVATGLGIATAAAAAPAMALVAVTAALGAIQLTYVIGYWWVVSWRTGMNHQKPTRVWPEDRPTRPAQPAAAAGPPTQRAPRTRAVPTRGARGGVARRRR
jgi:hypothetical protein